MTVALPTEAVEQRLLVQYLRLRGMPHWRTPNETFTKSWNQKRLNKDLGVVPGVPDMFVIIGNKLVAIEMKRQKGGNVSESQRNWLRLLNDCGVPSQVCRGFEEAKSFIESIERTSNGRN